MLKDTEILEYDNEKHKQFLINMFAKYGYKVVTNEYLESLNLNKGIILKQRVVDVVPAVLSIGIS